MPGADPGRPPDVEWGTEEEGARILAAIAAGRDLRPADPALLDAVDAADDHLARQPLESEPPEDLTRGVAGYSITPGDERDDLVGADVHDAKVRADTLAEVLGLLSVAADKAELAPSGPGWPSLAPGLREAMRLVEKARTS